MEEIASETTLQQAFEWLCKRRKDYSPNNDVWNLRRNWTEIRPQLRQALLTGNYRFSALDRFRTPGDQIELWSAQDALVLKAMAIVLTRRLTPSTSSGQPPRLSKNCYHLAGRGGTKAAVRAVVENLPQNEFVFRTDVKGFYASIDHDVMMGIVKEFIFDERILNLLRGYMQRVVYDDAWYYDIEKGISLGCPLSPLMGALYLHKLDEKMAESGLFYARFMDDWVILAPTRWKLRDAIRQVNQILEELKVEKHPDKTCIGRISRGFDFLGYHFSPKELTIAASAIKNRQERIARLYEQGADASRIGQYLQNWHRWATAAVPSLSNAAAAA